MALQRRTIVDQITVCRDASVNVRLLKQIVDGDTVLAEVPHRFVLTPGDNLESTLKVINTHLAREGWGKVVATDRQLIERVIAV